MQQQIKGKRGAPVSPIWGLFSDKPDVQMRTGPDHALCRHCHQDVRHHHKVVSVESHLRRCAPFIALMTETNPDERPEWWSHAKKKVKKVIQPVPTTLLNASALRTSIPDRKTEINGTHSTKSKRGAPVSPTWALFSDIPAVHSQSAPSHATCRHCHEEVRHHHKVSSVETHLRRCKPFIELVNQIDEEERPEWWTNPIKKVKRSKLMIESTPSSPPVVTKAKRSDLSAMAKGPSITKPVQPPTVLPTVSRLQQSTFQKKMAMHYYVTNSSFQRMEDGYLHEALELCRPGMILPTTEQLCHELLDLYFHETTSKVYSVLDKSDQLWCLLAINVTNTTSSSDSSGRMHYMAVSPQKTVLIASTEQAEEVMRVLDRLDNCVWSGMVTNDPALRRLWKRKYPGKFVHGCASSGLHKLASAVFTHTDTTSSPLEPLADFVDDCKEVVSCFTNDRTMMSKLKSAQIKANAPVHGLTTPQWMPIKWTSARMMFESLLDSYTYLLEMVEDSSFLIDVMGRHRKAQREQVKTIIQSDTFVPLLKKAIAIVSPLDKCMAMLESGAVATFVSDVFQTFGTLSSTFEAMEVLSKEEKDSLVSLLAAEREETCDDDHSIGNLLDPRFLGDGMSAEEREKHENMIFEFPIDDETSEELTNLLKTEYQAFRTVALEDRQSKASIYQMLDKGKITPFQYWQNKVNTWPTLACIGLRVFTMVTSTTVSQQTCATYGHINSKNTDLLTTEQLYKLVYIKYNTIQRQEESNGLDSSTDEETEDEMEN